MVYQRIYTTVMKPFSFEVFMMMTMAMVEGRYTTSGSHTPISNSLRLNPIVNGEMK